MKYRYIANSSAVARRIRKFYRREAEVVHPPVDTDRFQMAPESEIGDYGIVASRLVPYKRVDLAVRAFTKLKRPLKVVGTGRQLDSLKAIAGPTIEFLGYVSDADLPGLIARARMYLMPGEEDFGIAPVEANAAGVPVIAFAAGGALDVQVDGKSGLLFRRQNVDELCDAVERAYACDWDPEVIRQNAMRFDTPSFRAKIAAVEAAQQRGDLPDGFTATELVGLVIHLSRFWATGVPEYDVLTSKRRAERRRVVVEAVAALLADPSPAR